MARKLDDIMDLYHSSDALIRWLDAQFSDGDGSIYVDDTLRLLGYTMTRVINQVEDDNDRKRFIIMICSNLVNSNEIRDDDTCRH